MTRREFIAALGGAAVPWPLGVRAQQPAMPVKLTPMSSAGVFDSAGKLVRTLWSAKVTPDAQDPVAAWDGTIDDGSVAPSGDYVVKLLTNDVKYTWEGVIGNTSPDHINNITYHNYACVISDMAITDAGEMYFTTTYDERWNVMHVTTVANPQVADYVGWFRDTNNSQWCCCTDSNYVYFGQWISGGGNSNGAYAVNVANYTWPHTAGGGWPGKKQFVTFPYGTTPDGHGPSWIGRTETGQYIRDVAVQKTGNIFFIARIEVVSPQSWSIWTLYKTTGQVLQHNLLGYLEQGVIEANPTNNELWVAHNLTADDGSARSVVSKLSVNSAGILTETGVQIAGLQNALALAISPDGATILIADGGTSQQVRAFNTSNGSIKTAWGTSGRLGLAGGYANGPAVTNNKFMFRAHNGFSASGTGNPGAYIAFASDGSFWLGDWGNCRNLHFSSGNSPTYIERIAHMPPHGSAHVCYNDDTRYFAGFLEFKIDYSKPLDAGDNGSWVLANNWFYGLTGTTNVDQYRAMKFTGTYSNSRTYGTLYDPATGKRRVCEMTSSGMRDTGKMIPSGLYVDRGFNIWNIPQVGSGNAVQIKKNAFTGFDGSNNPTWQDDPSTNPTRVVITTEVIPPRFPEIEYQPNHTHDCGVPLRNGVVPFWSAHSNPFGTGIDVTVDNHLGGIDSATGLVKFSVHPPTNGNFGGAGTYLQYPDPPYFTIAHQGNPKNPGWTGLDDYGGGACVYLPGTSDIFTQYTGEMWGSNQTNMWSHWHETGLLVNRWGVAMPWFGISTIPYTAAQVDLPGDGSEDMPSEFWGSYKGYAGAAGNAFAAGIAHVGGKYYIYHNDEWYHGGVHRWRMDGLDTIQISNTAVTWNVSDYVAPTLDEDDLLAGLPFNAINLTDGAAGWHRNPAIDNTEGFNSAPWYRVFTNAIICDPRQSPDLVFEANMQSVHYTLYKDFPPRSSSGDWTIDSIIKFAQGPSHRGQGQLRIDILDATGKALLQIYSGNDEVHGLSLWVNDSAIHTPVTDNDRWLNYNKRLRSLVIQSNIAAGTMNVSYGGDWSISKGVYAVGANIAAPARIQFNYITNVGNPGNHSFLGICLTKLKFIE